VEIPLSGAARDEFKTGATTSPARLESDSVAGRPARHSPEAQPMADGRYIKS